MLEPIPKTSVTDAVLKQLVGLILHGSLGPGDRIPSERELCQRLEVSRPALREAKHALVAMKLLDARPGQGTFVRADLLDFITEPIDLGLRLEPMRMRELVETRAIVETAAAALAAERATDQDIAALRDICRRQKDAVDTNDIEAFMEADLDLHSAIASAARNAVLMRMNLALYGLVRALSRTVLDRAPSAAKSALVAHGEVVSAIATGEPERASQAMADHLETVASVVAEYFGSGEAQQEHGQGAEVRRALPPLGA
jgi:GntR family transcriptional regulator, transcriptional repressor for pyruvate dehydrogenase complex